MLSFQGWGQTLILLSQYSTTTPNCGQVEFTVTKPPLTSYQRFNIKYTSDGVNYSYIYSSSQLLPNNTPVSFSYPGSIYTGTFTAVFSNGLTLNTAMIEDNPNPITVTVIPLTDVTFFSSPVYCNGATSSPINFTSSISGATFSWTNSLTSIGVSSSGSANIPATLLANSSSNVSVANFLVTPSLSGCECIPSTFTVCNKPEFFISATLL